MPYNPAQCTHIKSNGAICRSPALKGHDKCYWHSHVESQVQGNVAFADLPVLDDGGSVQIVIMKIIRAIAEKRIDYKAAQLMIWALQVATRNMSTVNEYVVKEPGVDMRELLSAIMTRRKKASKPPQSPAVSEPTSARDANGSR